MRNILIHVSMTVVLLTGTYFICKRACQDHITPPRCSLRTNMRKLWSDHVWWTRNYLISTIANLPDKQAVTERLLQNQADIGAAIVPYYGQVAGDKLTSLLKDHILIAADVVAAAKNNATEKLKTANAKWHANADEIATFLSTANPNWPKHEMQKMMYDHLKLTTEEAVARIKQDWETDIASFEKVFHEIMVMSDGLTAGIAKQFPDQF